MPKRISKQKRDVNQIAAAVVEASTRTGQEEAEIDKSLLSRVMSAMGRKGGQVSGKRRMKNLTPEKRRDIALNAARTRWAKAKKKAS